MSARSFGTLGALVSVVLSIALNHQFGWGVLHFLCGWFYVIYVLACRSHEVLPALKALFS